MAPRAAKVGPMRCGLPTPPPPPPTPKGGFRASGGGASHRRGNSRGQRREAAAGRSSPLTNHRTSRPDSRYDSGRFLIPGGTQAAARRLSRSGGAAGGPSSAGAIPRGHTGLAGLPWLLAAALVFSRSVLKGFDHRQRDFSPGSRLERETDGCVCGEGD